VDSERLNVRTWTAMMRDAGVDFTEQDAVDHFVGRAYADGRATIVELTGAIPDPEWERTWRREFARSHEELDPIPGAREAVLAVQDLGHDIAVASGSLWQVIGTKLDRTGLVDLFPEEVRFSAEQVDRGKPAPDVFLLAAQRLGYSPAQCLVVEDSRAGVDAARAAGMGVVAYHSDLTPTDSLEAAAAVSTDMVDLPSVVARLTRT